MEVFKQQKYLCFIIIIPAAYAGYKAYRKLNTPKSEFITKHRTQKKTISINQQNHFIQMQQQDPSKGENISHYQFQSVKSVPQESILIQNLIEEKYWQYTHRPEEFLIEKITSQMSNLQVFEIFSNKLENLLLDINLGYKKIPYHNLTHAFDVTTCLDSILCTGFGEKLNLSASQYAFSLIAAYAHDINHQGFSDVFYKNSKHDWCTYYEHDSPLEKMHLRYLFSIFQNYDEIKLDQNSKQLMIKMILSTDNYFHKNQVELLEKINKEIQENEDQTKLIIKKNKNFLLGMCLHFSDLNNCSKDLDLFVLWSSRLFKEFQYQAEKQRKMSLPITYTMNISQVQKNCAQFSFIKNMVMPLFLELKFFCQTSFTQFEDGLEKNMNYYRRQKGRIRRQSA